jgi:hypothetical protein
MKNVKYEGVYPYMHDHSTGIFSLLQGEKLWTSSLLMIENVNVILPAKCC